MKRTGPSAASGLQSLSDRLSSWRELLERCRRKPTRKRVHALRVVTLRIQAEAEHDLSELPHASHEAQAIFNFGRQAERLRQALGSVRELDVWIGKLQNLRDSLGSATGYVPRSTRETARQIERLEESLAKKRERAGMKLVAEIKKRQDNLLLASRDVEEATSGREPESERDPAAKLLKRFAGIAAEFSAFDESNLHDFRKRIKKIRYLAEIYPRDAHCQQVAASMAKAQAAIGEWHDWQVLARTASEGKHANDQAAELLSSIAAEAYEAAVSTCHGVLGRMADLDRGSLSGLDHIRKAPVRADNAAPESAMKLA